MLQWVLPAIEKGLDLVAEPRSVNTALDKLLPFDSFWPALQIGTFHRLLNLQCPEVFEPKCSIKG